jgi:hypothetical protein
MNKKFLRKTMRNRRGRTRRGGSATSLPGAYFGIAKAGGPPVEAGKDVLGTYGNVIRSALGMSGGKRRRVTRKRGGFLPSIMGTFTTGVSKFIAPIALYAGYKLMTRKGKSGNKHRKSHKRR